MTVVSIVSDQQRRQTLLNQSIPFVHHHNNSSLYSTGQDNVQRCDHLAGAGISDGRYLWISSSLCPWIRIQISDSYKSIF